MNWPATAIATDGFDGDDIRRFAREIAAQKFHCFKVKICHYVFEIPGAKAIRC
jgi:hypothetical protein